MFQFLTVCVPVKALFVQIDFLLYLSIDPIEVCVRNRWHTVSIDRKILPLKINSMGQVKVT